MRPRTRRSRGLKLCGGQLIKTDQHGGATAEAGICSEDGGWSNGKQAVQVFALTEPRSLRNIILMGGTGIWAGGTFFFTWWRQMRAEAAQSGEARRADLPRVLARVPAVF